TSPILIFPSLDSGFRRKRSSTEILYFLEIPNKVSPFSTVCVFWANRLTKKSNPENMNNFFIMYSIEYLQNYLFQLNSQEQANWVAKRPSRLNKFQAKPGLRRHKRRSS